MGRLVFFANVRKSDVEITYLEFKLFNITQRWRITLPKGYVCLKYSYVIVGVFILSCVG